MKYSPQLPWSPLVWALCCSVRILSKTVNCSAKTHYCLKFLPCNKMLAWETPIGCKEQLLFGSSAEGSQCACQCEENILDTCQKIFVAARGNVTTPTVLQIFSDTIVTTSTALGLESDQSWWTTTVGAVDCSRVGMFQTALSARIIPYNWQDYLQNLDFHTQTME